jgi:4-oxalmesaconate hydratase
MIIDAHAHLVAPASLYARLTEELGFVGVLIHPDPGEGSAKTPPLGDPYWYPLYERLCELDLPGHIHSGNCCNCRKTYDEHFIADEVLAITSIYRAAVFERFPSLGNARRLFSRLDL